MRTRGPPLALHTREVARRPGSHQFGTSRAHAAIARRQPSSTPRSRSPLTVPAVREPVVTVITPSLNARPTIEETLRSVRMQDYPHVEHLVIDGGSTDGTVES